VGGEGEGEGRWGGKQKGIYEVETWGERCIITGKAEQLAPKRRGGGIEGGVDEGGEGWREGAGTVEDGGVRARERSGGERGLRRGEKSTTVRGAGSGGGGQEKRVATKGTERKW